MTNIESKHGIVSRQPYELYMSFTDLTNFVRTLPEDKQDLFRADMDTLSATVQGFNIGVKIHQRVPYSRIELVDYGAPFAFHIVVHFEPSTQDAFKTEFWITLEADLNLMMKMMLAGKIQEALDKVVDGIVDASNGKKPEGFDTQYWSK
jgi:hypothetical protein